ncbi:MAG: carboxypeptidase regulatory-like domain-containing protein [Vicinamibacteria bacterium]
MRSSRSILSAVAVLSFSTAVRSQAPPPKPAVPRAPVVKPTPPPPPVLEGVVRGPDRKPIEKALVAALPVAPPIGNRFFERPAPVSTRTDAAGRFRLVLRKHEPQTVRVEAAGLAAATRKDVTPGTPLTFDLTAGGSIEGSVRDGDTGQPAVNLRVVASQSGSFSVPDVAESGRVVARTDANGRFKVQGLASGLYHVSASGRGRGAAGRGSVRVGSRVDLVVFPAGSISGTVLGADGRPLAGATISPAARPWGWGSVEPVDDRGGFELNGLPPGVYDLVARAPGLAPSVAAEVTVDRRTDARIDLVVRPGARVVGRLVDANERPVGGKVAVGDLDGRPVPRLLAEPLATEAADDGRFAIDAVPPGEHALGVTAPGLARQRVDVAVREGERQVDLGDVRMEVGIAIRGRVRSKAGQPIADAVVRANVMRMGNDGVEARSEADGSFVLAGLEQGMYRVTAEAVGYGQEDKTAETGVEPVELVLSPAGTITGRVVDERSQPVESFRVSARTNERPGMGFRMPRVEETTSEDGRFTLSNVSAGDYVVSVSAAEMAAATVPGVKVAEGQSVDVGTVKLTAGGIVRGTVVDQTGAGVSGAAVAVAPLPQNWMTSGPPVEVSTDAAGAFELKGVAPGSADIGASHPNYASADPVSVQVDTAKPTTDVRLVLTVGGRIEGSIRKRDGSGRAGLMVNANPMARFRGTPSGFLSATTLPDGSFALEHVPAGRTNVTVMARTGGPMSALSMRTVDVREGETATLDIVDREILLSGRVTRSGAPGAGLRLDAMASKGMAFFGGMQQGAPAGPPTGPQRMTATTRDDGSFEMLVDEPGSYGLSVTTVDGRVRLPFRTVEVPDADAHAVELSFDGVAVTGVVVDKETEAPVPFASVSARPKEKDKATGATGATAGSDGRFQLEVEPGEYTLTANARDGGYGSAEAALQVGEGGTPDVRLALEKGLAIAGKVVDAAGRPAVGANVRALWSAGGSSAGGWAQTLPDGTFEMKGLREGSYTVLADGDNGSFALQANVATGARVTLALRPGARLSVTLKLPSGAPAAEIYPVVVRVGGVFVGSAGRTLGPTDAQGRTDMMVPAGDLYVFAFKDAATPAEKQGGGKQVSVAAGQTAAVTIQLAAGATWPDR